MTLLIDNYDSFTYNLYQYLRELGENVRVRRNDQITVESLRRKPPRRIVLSPGPGRPESAGVCLNVVRALAARVPILGVCLGHQAIVQAFGGRIVRASRLMHGKTSAVSHGGRGLYRGLPNPLTAVRYHSLIAERRRLPRCLRVTAETADGVVMGVRHRTLPCEGVQFHPESLLTAEGKRLLENFLRGRR
ncbi:MAG: aminodeoxychorismate/anthranilate synthase component II [Elusimicrobiota bacterium]